MSKKIKTSEDNDKIKCPACKKDLKSKEELEQHSFTHDFDHDTNFCHHPDCGEFFINQALLLSHINNTHKGKKAFPCKSKGCQTSFHTPGRLAEHMKMYHADELNESDFSEELQNDEKLKTGQKKKRKAKKVPKLKPSNTPFKGRRCPVVMNEEQTKKFNLWFPKNPIFECWHKGCCRQFKSEYGLDVHKLQHKKKDE